ncbi:MAG: hypothetical protein LLF76_14635 [Planctomycetaceae bacterium]|nr:hypothetical protein [Planctomycetaceae bacterium]
MKAKLLLAVVVLIVAFSAYPAYSQQPVSPGQQGEAAEPNSVGRMYHGKFCPMCGMAAQSILSTQLIATPDGGALLMAGGKLYKYDQNLTLVGQADLQVDIQQIQSKLQEFMSACPVRQTPAALDGLTDGTSNGMSKMKSASPSGKSPASSTRSTKE